MFWNFWRSADVTHAVETILDQKLRETVTSLGTLDALTAETARLSASVTALKREKQTLTADIDRERIDMKDKAERDETEMKFKLGLERMRQEQDAELAKTDLQAQRLRIAADQKLAVETARLQAKTEAAEEAREQMADFQERQEKMIDSLLKALPTAELFLNKDR